MIIQPDRTALTINAIINTAETILKIIGYIGIDILIVLLIIYMVRKLTTSNPH